MLPTDRFSYLRLVTFVSMLFPLVFYPVSVLAQNQNPPSPGPLPYINPNVTAASILENVSNQIPQLMRMITAIGYVFGMYLIIKGILMLKQYGEGRTMMSSDRSLKGPLIMTIVGTLMLYLPSTVWTGLYSFWSEPNPYGYVEQTDQWGQFINACFMIVQLIGTIAFIRGLIILSHLSGHGQQGTLSKGLTHLIAGIFCINIYQFVQVILVTFGILT